MENTGLISQNYLDSIIKKNKGEEYSILVKKIRVFFEDVRSFIQNEYKEDLTLDDYIDEFILSALGGLFIYSEVDDQPNKFILYSDSPRTNKIGTMLAIHYKDNIGEELKGRNWGYKAVRFALDEGLRWAFVTNGLKWRLYDAESISPYETYIEADLTNVLLLNEKSKQDEVLFSTFFESRTYFVKPNETKSQMDIHLDKSEKEIEKVESILKSKIEKIITDLSYGFIQSIGSKEFSENERRKIFEDSIILLYRMLFILYAESRNLLPINNQLYKKVSFFAIANNAKELFNTGELSAQHEEYSLWQQLDSLRGYINSGWEDIEMKAYNGGLFDNEKHNILKNYSITNSYFAEVLCEICFIKDKTGRFEEIINYKDLSVRNLGSLYEGLLEFNLFIAKEELVRRTSKGKVSYIPTSKTQLKQSDRNNIIPPGRIYLSQNALERKETGSYYTPEDIVNYIITNAIGKKLIDIKSEFQSMYEYEIRKLKLAVTESEIRAIQKGIDVKISLFIKEKVLSLSVIDSAMGSGHFLVNSVYYITNIVMDIINSTDWENEEVDCSLSFWKTKIVSNCIYGIDLNPLAVHLGKLSLWLISAARNKPLSFVDHHLKVGNSIIGITKSKIDEMIAQMTKDEHTLFTMLYKNLIQDIVQKYTRISEFNEDTKDQVHAKKEVYEVISQEMELLKRKYDIILAMLINNEGDLKNNLLDILQINDVSFISSESPIYKKFINFAEKNKFFHWELEFPDVFSKNGFDVVIGNPPYVVTNSNIYNHSISETLTTGNLFSFMMEKGILVLNDNGYFGMIVPISSVSGETMVPLQNFMIENLSEIYVSNYSTRPSKLFPKVEQRLSIILGKKEIEKEGCEIFTTRYLKWFADERKQLFSHMHSYAPCEIFVKVNGVIPKIGDAIENKIFNKLLAKQKILGELISNEGEKEFYYHGTPRYWIKGMDYAPKYHSEKEGEGISSEYKLILFESEEKLSVYGCVLNSTLFYWWWNLLSDCRHLNKRDINSFPFDFEQLKDTELMELKLLFENLMENFKLNKTEISMNLGGRKGIVTLESIDHKQSKQFIDEIDSALAKYYAFDLDELDYIKNYDLRFRMGVEDSE